MTALSTITGEALPATAFVADAFAAQRVQSALMRAEIAAEVFHDYSSTAPHIDDDQTFAELEDEYFASRESLKIQLLAALGVEGHRIAAVLS